MEIIFYTKKKCVGLTQLSARVARARTKYERFYSSNSDTVFINWNKFLNLKNDSIQRYFTIIFDCMYLVRYEKKNVLLLSYKLNEKMIGVDSGLDEK